MNVKKVDSGGSLPTVVLTVSGFALTMLGLGELAALAILTLDSCDLVAMLVGWEKCFVVGIRNYEGRLCFCGVCVVLVLGKLWLKLGHVAVI